MKRKGLILIVGLICLLLVLAGCGGGTNQSDSNAGTQPGQESEKEMVDFSGKKVTLIVPYSTGGGYDTYARMIVPYLEKHTGATIIVRNIDGGGGLVGTNQLYVAKPDGLTIGIVNGFSALVSQVLEQKGVQFDVNKFTWICRVTFDPKVIVVGANSKYKTIDDMINATEPITIGVSGAGSDEAYLAVALKEALGFPADIITGYAGQANTQMAMLQGEVECNVASVSSRLSVIQSGDARALVQLSKDPSPYIPDVPMATSIDSKIPDADKILAATVGITEVGRPIVAPPGVSPEVAAYWRDAFNKTLNDPELVKFATDSQRDIYYMPGEEIDGLVKNAMDMPGILKEALLSVSIQQ